jgi:serine/threonine protein kinase
MGFSVENVCGFLIRSRLMTPDEMKAMYQRWQSEAGQHAASAARFGRWLVVNKYVTEYQEKLLLRGHADGFFLNHYRVLERIGRGRMAGVYKAVHPLGQVVAAKVLPPSRAKNQQTLGRFQREAQLSLQLNHPNIVRSFQTGLAGDLHYLVMEYLEGETLDEVLQRRKRLPPAEAVRLVHQALHGLQHIHDKGMVHRDLKPANLMLTWPSAADGADAAHTLKATLKILDIGLGRQLYDESQPEAPDDRIELTAEGVILGTPDYLAPEQARDPRTIDIRADIYSLGCVLYHALAGTPPFPDRNLLSQMVKHATQKAPPLREFNADVPDGLQQIVDWMMAKKPEERYSTPARAAQALEMYLLADSEPARPIEAEPRMRKYLTWLEQGQGQVADAATVELPPPQPSQSRPTEPIQRRVATDSRGEPSSQSEPSDAPAARTHRSKPKAANQTGRRRRDEQAARVQKPAQPPAQAPARPPAQPPVPSPTNESPEAFELIPAVAPSLPKSAGGSLSPRAWLFIGISSGAVLMLAIVVLVLILAFGS